MRVLTIIALLLFAITSCQQDNGGSTEIRPEFINFAAIENNVGEMSAGRKSEAVQGRIQLVNLNSEIVVIIDQTEDDQSLAYVLQTETPAELGNISMDRGWAVYLQDHLLLFDGGRNQSIRLSIGDRALDSPVINESATFSKTIKGYGIARYWGQGVRAEDLEGMQSYLQARSNL